MKEYTDEEYEQVFNAMSKAVDGEPVMVIMSAALSLIGNLFTHAIDDDAVRLLAFDCYNAITRMAEETIAEMESDGKKRH